MTYKKGILPISLAIWEAKIRRIVVQGKLGQIALETPSPK
jgi:hypothetical protein